MQLVSSLFPRFVDPWLIQFNFASTQRRTLFPLLYSPCSIRLGRQDRASVYRPLRPDLGDRKVTRCALPLSTSDRFEQTRLTANSCVHGYSVVRRSLFGDSSTERRSRKSEYPLASYRSVSLAPHCPWVQHLYEYTLLVGLCGNGREKEHHSIGKVESLERLGISFVGRDGGSALRSKRRRRRLLQRRNTATPIPAIATILTFSS